MHSAPTKKKIVVSTVKIALLDMFLSNFPFLSLKRCILDIIANCPAYKDFVTVNPQPHAVVVLPLQVYIKVTAEVKLVSVVPKIKGVGHKCIAQKVCPVQRV
jgi:hypothetical protein